MKSILVSIGLAVGIAAITLAHAGEKKYERDAGSGCARTFATDFSDRWIMTRDQAKRYVADQVPGKPVRVCADARAADPHYHADVRLPHGQLARLNVNAHTGELSWRDPAVLQD